MSSHNIRRKNINSLKFDKVKKQNLLVLKNNSVSQRMHEASFLLLCIVDILYQLIFFKNIARYTKQIPNKILQYTCSGKIGEALHNMM